MILHSLDLRFCLQEDELPLPGKGSLKSGQVLLKSKNKTKRGTVNKQRRFGSLQEKLHRTFQCIECERDRNTYILNAVGLELVPTKGISYAHA